VANNKLYVSNSGGLDYPDCDNSVSVFDCNTLNKIKDITVRMNPRQIKADKNGNVYVVSDEVWDWDNYVILSASCLQRIDGKSDEVKVLFDEITGFDIYDNLLYFYTYDYVNASYQIFDLVQNSITNANFISGGNIQTPYGININPNNGDVYIFDALDYTSTGDVYCFDKNGTKKFQFGAGLLPKKAVFK
jgi:YVTN family beta-propeller protein